MNGLTDHEICGARVVNRPSDVSAMLRAASNGDEKVVDRVVPIVYDELRRIAHRQLGREAPGHTLSTTGLVHEAYLKLANLDRLQWKSREHFFAVAARIIRQVLVDYAVRRKAKKRGGGEKPLTLEEEVALPADRPDQWIALDEALQRLEAVSERQARIVECRFFAGLSVPETANALDLSSATVKRDWALARAWLNRELSP